MWIETEAGVYINSEHVVLVEKLGVPKPGSAPQDPDYAEGWEWRVRVDLLPDSRLVLAAGLTEAEAEALMPRVLSGLRFAKYLSVAEELRQVRTMLAKGGA